MKKLVGLALVLGLFPVLAHAEVCTQMQDGSMRLEDGRECPPVKVTLVKIVKVTERGAYTFEAEDGSTVVIGCLRDGAFRPNLTVAVVRPGEAYNQDSIEAWQRSTSMEACLETVRDIGGRRINHLTLSQPFHPNLFRNKYNHVDLME
jgi:hypothetical protein